MQAVQSGCPGHWDVPLGNHSGGVAKARHSDGEGVEWEGERRVGQRSGGGGGSGGRGKATTPRGGVRVSGALPSAVGGEGDGHARGERTGAGAGAGALAGWRWMVTRRSMCARQMGHCARGVEAGVLEGD